METNLKKDQNVTEQSSSSILSQVSRNWNLQKKIPVFGGLRAVGRPGRGARAVARKAGLAGRFGVLGVQFR